MSDKDRQIDHLAELAASLDVPALTPGQIHLALKLLVEEVIKQRNHGHDGGEF